MSEIICDFVFLLERDRKIATSIARERKFDFPKELVKIRIVLPLGFERRRTKGVLLLSSALLRHLALNSKKKFLSSTTVDSIPGFFGERNKKASTLCSGNYSCGLPVEEGRGNGLLRLTKFNHPIESLRYNSFRIWF